MARKFTSLSRTFIVLSAMALGISTSAVQAKIKYTVLHSFGVANDGSKPNGDLVFDSSGNLYGTTQAGGTANAGTIFKLAPDGTETVLHSFDGKAGGAEPEAGVTIDMGTGDLYGSTTVGGSNSGVIWKLAFNGTYTVLHTFDYVHGAYPEWPLIRDKKGNLYGATVWSENGTEGVVYELTSRGTYEILYSGNFPYGRLVRDFAGNLYGAMQFGGNYGSVFELAPDGTLTTLHQFNNYDDGAEPTGGLTRDKDGNLYGTTQQGGNGATLFEIAADGTYTNLHDFTQVGLPYDNIVRTKVGTFYGASAGGGEDGAGTVYEVAPDGSEKILYAFTHKETGKAPVGGLVMRNGVLYGATMYSGPNRGGVIFSLTTK